MVASRFSTDFAGALADHVDAFADTAIPYKVVGAASATNISAIITPQKETQEFGEGGTAHIDAIDVEVSAGDIASPAMGDTITFNSDNYRVTGVTRGVAGVWLLEARIDEQEGWGAGSRRLPR
jgi:hypothetical protein